MSRKTWVILIAVALAGAGGIAFAIWYANRRSADGSAEAQIARELATQTEMNPAASLADRRLAAAERVLRHLERQYVLYSQQSPVNPLLMATTENQIRAIVRRYPSLQTTLR